MDGFPTPRAGGTEEVLEVTSGVLVMAGETLGGGVG